MDLKSAHSIRLVFAVALAIFLQVIVAMFLALKHQIERLEQATAEVQKTQSVVARQLQSTVSIQLEGPVDTILLAQPWESCNDLDGRLPAGNGKAGYIYAFPAPEEK